MIYSVWDHARREYDYYQTPEKNGATQSPPPKHIRRHKLGITPEEAAWPLPANAVRVGAGKYPKGHVATRRGGLGGIGPLGIIPDLTPTNAVLLGALGWMVWTYMIKPTQGR